ncbi:MAG TPA: hypothetical protein VFL92_04345 [Sphingomonas sp.]|nr:hypothetical protein [Sphingomonas sp.]
MDDIEITQSRFGTKLRFKFLADHFEADWADASGRRTFSVPYESLNLKSTATLTVNNNVFGWRLRLIPLATFILGVVLGGFAVNIAGLIELLSIIAFVGLLGCSYLKLFRVSFILIPLSPVPPGGVNALWVIDDRRRDAIMQELVQHWRSKLRLKFAAIDLANDRQRELAKFNWLKEHEVIDESEYREAMRLLQSDTETPPAPLLN